MRNADKFSRLLERAAKDAANVEKNRGDEVYNNIRIILQAIMGDRDFAQEIFDDSVGGEIRCINNAMEKIGALAKKSNDYLVIKGIKEGRVDLQAFIKACMQNLALETLHTYIEGIAIPFLGLREPYRSLRDEDIKRDHPEWAAQNLTAPEETLDLAEKAIPGDWEWKRWENSETAKLYGAEVAQSLKWTLKEKLEGKGVGLPETVNPSTASYPGKKTWHEIFAEKAEKHVMETISDPEKKQAYLQADPLWRQGIVAFIMKKEGGNPLDAKRLKNCTEAGSFIEHEGTIYDEKGEAVDDPNTHIAYPANEQLEDLYMPAVRHVKGEGTEPDRFEVVHPEHAELYDQIRKLKNEFKVSIQKVEQQLAAHVTPAILSDSPRLPEDGQFKPTFELPGEWAARMAVIRPQSRQVEIVELTQKNQERAQLLRTLDKEISVSKQRIQNKWGKTEAEMNQLIEDLISYDKKKKAAGGSISEQSPLHAFETAGKQEKEIPEALLDLNYKVVLRNDERTYYAKTNENLKTLQGSEDSVWKGKGKATP